MKKIIYSLMLLLATSSCDYLDIVPDNKSTLADAFKNETTTKRFVYTLYGYIPDLFRFDYSNSFCGADELVCGMQGDTYWYSYKSIIYDMNSPSSPVYNYWSNQGHRPINMYAAIRQCYLFLDNVDKVPGVDPANATTWKAEAHFLIGYFHFLILQNHGPAVLVKELVSTDVTGEKLFPKRSTYDECVKFIVDELDYAAKYLPETIDQPKELGRVTVVAALALKSRVLLYAASPLTNGNTEYYSAFKNKDGEPLINQVYNAEKWEDARKAALAAINLAVTTGSELYYYKKGTNLNDFDKAVANYRYAFVDKWNSEVLWGITQSATGGADGNYHTQRTMVPRNPKVALLNGETVPTFPTVERFYTKNGLPLNEDPLTQGQDLYVVASGDSTAMLNRNREPRFYACIGFDRGPFEFNSTFFIEHLRAGEPSGYDAASPYNNSTGYNCKKWVHPDSGVDEATQVINTVRYPYPMLRLAEMYLNYIEADFEYDGELDDNSITYWNLIRSRAGLKGIKETWKSLGGLPGGDKLRQLIHQERGIELIMENHRYFDLRRWKEAHLNLSKPLKSWNIKGRTQDDFYKVVTMEESGVRSFTHPRNYFAPIPLEDVKINPNLVQNPGW